MAIGKNLVKLVGEIHSEYMFSHECGNEKFYIVMVSIERLSGVCDIIPVCVSDRLTDVTFDDWGRMIEVVGSYRSFNEYGKSKVRLYVLANSFKAPPEEITANNAIGLEGYIARLPLYRETPSGRQITEFLVAVNSYNGKSSYIPCIAWSRTAVYVSSLEVGTAVKIEGRIQSRDYRKRYEDGSEEQKTTYEVSTQRVDLWTED